MLLCNDSLIKIKFDDEYKVWNNFSILYKNKVYDYTEYRVVNDIINLCNSSDDCVRDSWKLRIEWMKRHLPFEHCSVSVDGFFRNNYTLLKNFSVFFKPSQQSFTWKEHGVVSGYFRICSAKLSLSCIDHLVRVKYGRQYKVFKKFLLSYHQKHYAYHQYRFGQDTFEMCASNDPRVQAIWKKENSWNKEI